MIQTTLVLFAFSALHLCQCYAFDLPFRRAEARDNAATTTSSPLFKPTVGATWNIELIDVPKVSQADNQDYYIWDYDMASAPRSTIQAFQSKGHKVLCYFSAGTWENWRADANEFPKSALGKTLGGWPNEKWLNTSNPKVREIMQQRMEDAYAKGCDGIDPDNIDGYENDTGFDLTKDDAVDYIRFLAGYAHARGMAYGLKNGGGIVERVIDLSQWCINEQCVQYSECELYQPFIEAGKPVFHIEYTDKSPAPVAFVEKSCDAPHAKGFSTLVKHLNLSGWTTTCESVESETSDAVGSEVSMMTWWLLLVVVALFSIVMIYR